MVSGIGDSCHGVGERGLTRQPLLDEFSDEVSLLPIRDEYPEEALDRHTEDETHFPPPGQRHRRQTLYERLDLAMVTRFTVQA